MRSGALALLTGLALAFPVGAQDSDSSTSAPQTRARIQVQTSPLPRARTLRPPSQTDEGARLPSGTEGESDTAAIETRPLDDPITPTPDADADAGSGTAPNTAPNDDVAATQDASTDGAGTNDDPTGPVAVVRPQTGDDGRQNARSDAIDDDTAGATGGRVALRPEPDDAEVDEDDDADDGTGRTRWQRARARRFRQAPKSPGRLTVNTPPPIVPIATVATELKTGARLRQLDKMTGQTETFDITVGESRQIARLQIRLDACRAPDNNATSGTMAFVKVWDTKPGDDDAPEFTGWMFADSPALSALDHPRYDLWVINCTRSSAPASASTE